MYECCDGYCVCRGHISREILGEERCWSMYSVSRSGGGIVKEGFVDMVRGLRRGVKAGSALTLLPLSSLLC